MLILYIVAAPNQAEYGPGTGLFWFSNLNCDGSEQNLINCSRTSLTDSICTDATSKSPKLICDRKSQKCMYGYDFNHFF